MNSYGCLPQTPKGNRGSGYRPSHEPTPDTATAIVSAEILSGLSWETLQAKKKKISDRTCQAATSHSQTLRGKQLKIQLKSCQQSLFFPSVRVFYFAAVNLKDGKAPHIDNSTILYPEKCQLRTRSAHSFQSPRAYKTQALKRDFFSRFRTLCTYLWMGVHHSLFSVGIYYPQDCGVLAHSFQKDQFSTPRKPQQQQTEFIPTFLQVRDI